MKSLFGVLLLTAFVATAPTGDETSTIVISEDFFISDNVIYTAKYDIVDLYLPINDLNFDDENDSEDVVLFFTEAKINPTGKNAYKGLYHLKNRKATKLLDFGRVTTGSIENKDIYFGAKDGLYIYNEKENKAEKYGTFTDSIIGIDKDNSTDVIYVLTDDKTLYKVSNNGTQKEEVTECKNIEEFVLDYSNNLYYYGADKQLYVKTDDGVTKVEGLPENPSYIKLIKPPFVLEDAITLVSGKYGYTVYSNGSIELSDFELKAKPSAYAINAAILDYFAYNRKIYEFNVLTMLLGDMLDELKSYLNDNKDEIQSIASKPVNQLRGI